MTDLAHLRGAARNGTCPLCGEGPWRALAKHVAKKHQVDARELKRRLDIPASHGLNDPDVTESQRRAKREQGAPPGLIEAGRTSRRSEAISAAGREARTAGARRAGLARVGASHRKIPLEATTMKRPCEVCGRDLPIMARGHARTCSARCRKALSRREKNGSDVLVEHTPEETP